MSTRSRRLPSPLPRPPFSPTRVPVSWKAIQPTPPALIRAMEQDWSDFEASMAAIRQGSETAIWRLIEAFGPHIRQVVRRRIDRRLRGRYDSMDFVQMVWVTFFREPEKIAQFRKPEELMRYLTTVAKNKVIEEIRHSRTEKQDVSRERAIENEAEVEVSANTETPEQIAMAKEFWSQLMAGQSDRDKQIVQLRLSGKSYREIADQLEIHERTARKVIERLLESQRRRTKE